MEDRVLINLQQLCQVFDVKPRRVRQWVSAGLLVPVAREGRGRSRAMHFNRGDVSDLVYGCCEACGNRYKRATLKQRFCCDKCRKRYHYRISAKVLPREGPEADNITPDCEKKYAAKNN